MSASTRADRDMALRGAGNLSSLRPSWPLLVATYTFLFGLYMGHVTGLLLLDGDTYSHIATGRWILEHHSVPSADPFSHTMRGAPWITQEWGSQVILASAHATGGWNLVVALTSAAFALTMAQLMAALLRWMPPARALIFTLLVMLMVAGHLLARPHIVALPVFTAWMVELFVARDEERAPRWWLLAVVVLWANLHGSFTLGIAVACVLALEAVLAARGTVRMLPVAWAWGRFLILAATCALFTPNGVHAYLFTWQALAQDTYVLQRVAEWASPNFHHFQALEIWLLGGFALVLSQGLRLPVIRLLLLLGLTHLALKHLRSVEYLGLIGALAVAAPFGAQWACRNPELTTTGSLDPWVRPGGAAALALTAALMISASALFSLSRPVEPPQAIAPSKAIAAARAAGLDGPVLNAYSWGGFLLYSGIPDFIDGRSDMFRDAFLRQYTDATELAKPGALEDVLAKYSIEWTLLAPGSAAVVMLDHLPGWHRVYADDVAVVHARVGTLDLETKEVTAR